MNTTEHPNKKKIERIAYISFGILVIFIVIGIYMLQAEKKKFREEGIRVDATVNSLNKSGTTKRKSYTMDISMFTEGYTKVVKSDTTGKSAGEKAVEAIFDKISSNNRYGEKYQSLTINIGSTSYYKYKPGDRIKVVYLKEDSTDVRLLSEVE